MNTLQNPMPTLAEAKELTKHIKRGIGNTTILINAVAPIVTSTGVVISEAAQKEQQSEMNKKGMLVVHSPFKREETDETNPNAFFEGERVLFGRNTEASGSIVLQSKEELDGLNLPENYDRKSSNLFKAYVVLIIDAFNVVCVVE